MWLGWLVPFQSTKPTLFSQAPSKLPRGHGTASGHVLGGSSTQGAPSRFLLSGKGCLPVEKCSTTTRRAFLGRTRQLLPCALCKPALLPMPVWPRQSVGLVQRLRGPCGPCSRSWPQTRFKGVKETPGQPHPLSCTGVTPRGTFPIPQRAGAGVGSDPAAPTAPRTTGQGRYLLLAGIACRPPGQNPSGACSQP